MPSYLRGQEPFLSKKDVNLGIYRSKNGGVSASQRGNTMLKVRDIAVATLGLEVSRDGKGS